MYLNGRRPLPEIALLSQPTRKLEHGLELMKIRRWSPSGGLYSSRFPSIPSIPSIFQDVSLINYSNLGHCSYLFFFSFFFFSGSSFLWPVLVADDHFLVQCRSGGLGRRR